MIDIKEVVSNKADEPVNKKWVVKRLTINLTSGEAENLDKYCSTTGRPATDVIRELIRSLNVE
ncbi:CopG family transcriptional regulator [Nostoc sp. FACHB-87]|uniref:CopG family transcriptional regulator n=1 Tax=Nostocaceae TaxID=1162 RepID=UPI001686CBEF|nr:MULTISPECIES: CopG family transcriptional regulator [Nostocaceae]MBD2303725.1 CopG family transcriptional regulator [Nostoc sp. FACHB-190]MBD2458781.1 CopG family transcriptional regulator [Nostoc sp. FACHB-87]MBD2479799.1 CopG family transcriptional regulator [Anabaena sp. FACHB-83]